MSQFFLNQRKTLISDATEGMLTTHPNIVRLKTGKAIHVLLRKDWQKDKVAIISGGGSGHEPAHSGFIGKGMLTAAVCGDLFASPSVNAVLSAIIAVSGDAGCVLIVKNYTGDRLNFGLAATRAKQLGYQVEMIIVGDDISLPKAKQPRGLAGTLFIHKIAGALSESGKTLQEIMAVLNEANQGLETLGVSMTGCHLPETNQEHYIPENSIEIGLGIHGEKGVSTFASQNAQEVIEEMLRQFKIDAQGNEKYAIMLNNLGGVSHLEMSVLAKYLTFSHVAESIRYFFGPKAFMTALDMKGFSISFLKLNEQITKALLAETEVDNWETAKPLAKMQWLDFEDGNINPHYPPSENTKTAQYVQLICEKLISCEKHLNELDAKVGDGDTGTTFASGAKAILHLLKNKQLPLNNNAELFDSIANNLSESMGGSSGVLLSILFTASAEHYGHSQKLIDSLIAGLETMKKYGGARLGDRTLIDALEPALMALKKEAPMQEAAKIAHDAAQATANITVTASGRSSYISAENLSGNADPGAIAVAQVFQSLLSIK